MFIVVFVFFVGHGEEMVYIPVLAKEVFLRGRRRWDTTGLIDPDKCGYEAVYVMHRKSEGRGDVMTLWR